MKNRRLQTMGALAMSVWAASAWAQQPLEVPGFDAERVTLNAGATHTLLVNTGDGLAHKSLRASLVGHYEHDVLVFAVNGQRIGSVIGSRFTTHFMGAYGVLPWLEVSAQLPVVWAQGGDDLTTRGVALPASTALGSAQLQGRFTVLRESKGQPLDLGIALALSLPTGSASALTRDPGSGVAGALRVGAGRRLGWARVGGELGLVLREAAVLSPTSVSVYDEVGPQVTWALAASTVGHDLRGEVSLRGVVPTTQARVSAELTLGARYALLDGALEVFALIGPGFGITPGTPAFRALAGLAWTPSFAAAAPPSPVEEVKSAPVQPKLAPKSSPADESKPPPQQEESKPTEFPALEL